MRLTLPPPAAEVVLIEPPEPMFTLPKAASSTAPPPEVIAPLTLMLALFAESGVAVRRKTFTLPECEALRLVVPVLKTSTKPPAWSARVFGEVPFVVSAKMLPPSAVRLIVGLEIVPPLPGSLMLPLPAAVTVTEVLPVTSAPSPILPLPPLARLTIPPDRAPVVVIEPVLVRLKTPPDVDAARLTAPALAM